MGTSYHTLRRVNVESFEVVSPGGETQAVTLRLDGYSAPTEADSDLDSVTLTMEIDGNQVRVAAPNLSRLLHPMIEALRLLLAAQTVNEDDLDDAWTAAR